MINNSQNDISNLNYLISSNDLELKGIDSLMKVSKTDFTKAQCQDSIFFYAYKYTSNLHIFTFNDLTLVQLRNAGGYSLIRTSYVADTIALYEYKNSNIILQERFYTDSYVQTWAVLKEVFDVTVADRFFQSYATANRIPSSFCVLISKDQEKMYLLYNNYWTFAITLNGYNNMLRVHLDYLKGFIEFLKRNYDLK